MIPLYKNTNHIDIASLDSLCFDGNLEAEIEQKFAEYVGAKHACVARNPYDILYLIFEAVRIQIYDGLSKPSEQKGINSKVMHVPSNVPHQIVNSIINSGLTFCWDDNPSWIGKPYTLVDTADAFAYHEGLRSGSRSGAVGPNDEEGGNGFKVIYSGHFIEPKYYEKNKNVSNSDLVVYSFEPGHPLSGVGGGIIVSNNEETIAYIKNKVHGGLEYTVTRQSSYREFSERNPHIEREMRREALAHEDIKDIELAKSQVRTRLRQQQEMYHRAKVSGAIRKHLLMVDGLVTPELDGVSNNYGGWNMAASPIECLTAINALQRIDKTNKSLEKIREKYNEAFNVKNKSGTLYRLKIKDASKFRESMAADGVETGMHYAHLHHNIMWPIASPSSMSKTELEFDKTVTIPFHDDLSTKDVNLIIKTVLEHK